MGVYEMNTESYFQDVRRSAERETYDDGLMEIVIGVLLFIAALATGRPAFIWTYLVAILVLGPGLIRLKARFTFPRIGYVQMPDEDPGRLRKGVVTWVLGVFFLSAVVLAIAGLLTDNLAWRRAAPAIGGLLFSGGFLYLAQRSQSWRHYLLVIASVLFGVVMVFPLESEPYGNFRVWALLMSLLCLGMGAYVLWRFVKRNPVVEERTPDE